MSDIIFIDTELINLTGARVIFFSSSLTRASMVPSTALVYVATKGAIEQIARVLAKDLGASEITVNTVSPGPVDTDLFRADKSESQIQFFRNLHPSKRLGQTDDISAVVAFLVQPEAKWINGQNILVNGVRFNLCTSAITNTLVGLRRLILPATN